MIPKFIDIFRVLSYTSGLWLKFYEAPSGSFYVKYPTDKHTDTQPAWQS